MATTTVNNLTALTSADSGDKIPIWDISAGQYKAITKANLVSGAISGTSLTVPQTTVDVAQDLWIADPANPLSTNFGLRIENATFLGVRDTTYQLGFNRGADRDTTKACMHLQWEDHYQYGAILSRSEFMLQCYAPSGIGGAVSRPWQVNLEHQIDQISNGFSADGHGFYFRGAYSDTAAYYFAIGPTTVAIAGAGLRFDTNNLTVISQLAPGGGGYYKLLKLDATSRIVIGEIGTSMLVPTASQFDNIITILPGGLGTLNTAIKFGWTNDARTQHHISTRHAATGADNRMAFLISDGSDSDRNEVLSITGDKRMGINDLTPDATLDISTADAAAVPVLQLEQLDVSEQMISFVSTEGVGNAIEDKGAKTLTVTKFVKVLINGVPLHLAVGTI